MTMEDAKIYNKDIYMMYPDSKGAFNVADHRIMFKHMRQTGMPSTLVDTNEQLCGVSTTDYITPYGPTPFIDINCGTLRGDTLSPFLVTLFLENPSSVSSQSVADATAPKPPPLMLNADPSEPTATYPGHGFADDLSLATGSPTNMTIHLQKLSLVSAYTCMIVNVRTYCITCAHSSRPAYKATSSPLTRATPPSPPSAPRNPTGSSGSNSTPPSPSPSIGKN
jgi:hypothetical protein